MTEESLLIVDHESSQRHLKDQGDKLLGCKLEFRNKLFPFIPNPLSLPERPGDQKKTSHHERIRDTNLCSPVQQRGMSSNIFDPLKM